MHPLVIFFEVVLVNYDYRVIPYRTHLSYLWYLCLCNCSVEALAFQSCTVFGYPAGNIVSRHHFVYFSEQILLLLEDYMG